MGAVINTEALPRLDRSSKLCRQGRDLRLLHVSKQVSYGLHELLKNNAANIHSCEDWSVIFTLLEVVGAGASPDVEVGAGAQAGARAGGRADARAGPGPGSGPRPGPEPGTDNRSPEGG